MSVLAIVAFAAGLLLGVLFRPLSVVALAAVVVLALVLFGPHFGIAPLSGGLLAVALINLGYLAGTAMTGRWRRSKDPNVIDR